MKSLLLVGGGILIGVGLSWGEAYRQTEVAAQERYREQLQSYTRANEMADRLRENWDVEPPAATEQDLDAADESNDAIRVGGEMVAETSLSDITPSADYLAAARDYSPSETAVEALQIEYITEDEFHEEDGNDKEQILIHMGEQEPLFINNGLVVEDWKELISPNILVDMYQRIPPGTDTRVLYVRNHRLGTDYEVIQEIP